MAKRYQAPELGPTNAEVKKNGLPFTESNEAILVKFFFRNKGAVPYGIQTREKQDAFKTNERGVRMDTGTCVSDRSGVSAQLLRTGIANAQGHSWKLVSVAQWDKAITDPRMRKQYEDAGEEPIQTVVQLAYQLNPDPSKGPLELTRPVRDSIVILANRFSWTCRVWHNDGGPITVNFTSPSEEDPTTALVVRDGALTFVPVEIKAAV